jgi:hypothetical protein
LIFSDLVILEEFLECISLFIGTVLLSLLLFLLILQLLQQLLQCLLVLLIEIDLFVTLLLAIEGALLDRRIGSHLIWDDTHGMYHDIGDCDHMLRYQLQHILDIIL